MNLLARRAAPRRALPHPEREQPLAETRAQVFAAAVRVEDEASRRSAPAERRVDHRAREDAIADVAEPPGEDASASTDSAPRRNTTSGDRPADT